MFPYALPYLSGPVGEDGPDTFLRFLLFLFKALSWCFLSALDGFLVGGFAIGTEGDLASENAVTGDELLDTFEAVRSVMLFLLVELGVLGSFVPLTTLLSPFG